MAYENDQKYSAKGIKITFSLKKIASVDVIANDSNLVRFCELLFCGDEGVRSNELMCLALKLA